MRAVELPRVFRVSKHADPIAPIALNASLQEYRVSLGDRRDAYAALGGRAAQWVEIVKRADSGKIATCYTVDAAATGASHFTSSEENAADLALYANLVAPHKRKKGSASCVLLGAEEQHEVETVRRVYCLCAEYAHVALASFSLGKCDDAFIVCTDYLAAQTLAADCAVPLWFVTRWNEALITVGQIGLEHARHDCRDDVVTWQARFGPSMREC